MTQTIRAWDVDCTELNLDWYPVICSLISYNQQDQIIKKYIFLKT